MVSLQRWGRWHSQIQPRRYSNAPPAWRLPDKLQLPFPVATTNSPVRDMDWRLVPIPQLWPKDTFVKPPAAPIRAPLQLERACAAAVPPPSSARDSAASRSLYESTDTDRSDTTSQCSNMSSVELSQPTDQAASGVPPTPHAQSPVPPPAQTVATSCAAGDSRRAPVGPDLSTGHPGASASAPTSPQSCDGSIGPLDRNPNTTRPQSPTGLPPPKRRVPGVAPRADAASHHGYELTAPRRGIAYAHWRPLWLCEALPSPLSTVPSNTAGSPTPGSPVCGGTAEGVDEHSAGSSGADDQPIAGFPADVDMQPTDGAEPLHCSRSWSDVAYPFTVGASPSTSASAGHRPHCRFRRVADDSQDHYGHQSHEPFVFHAAGDSGYGPTGSGVSGQRSHT